MTPPMSVLMFRLEAAADCSNVPASQRTLPTVPSVLIWYFFRCPSQKGSPVTGWKEPS